MSSKILMTRLAIFCLVPILGGASADSQLADKNAPQTNQQPSSFQVVILLDINPNQRKEFSLESDLAAGVLDHLDQRDAAVSLITFGSGDPTVRSANAKPDEAIDGIKSLNLEQSGERYFPIHLYKAMDLALNQFTDDARPKSLLIIAEGREDFDGRAFKQVVSRARQLKINCSVALLTWVGRKSMGISYG